MILAADILQALSFGLAVVFMLIGVVGTIIPAVPGTLLVWLTVIVYAIAERSNGMAAIDPLSFVVLTVIAVVTGLADLWLPLLGAQVKRTSKRAMALGLAGGIIGTFIAPLIGTVIGYGLGVLLGEYHKARDWDKAMSASVTAMTHWGIGTAVQFGGALLMVIIFVWQVLSYAS